MGQSTQRNIQGADQARRGDPAGRARPRHL